jgi:hypothetical protein
MVNYVGQEKILDFPEMKYSFFYWKTGGPRYNRPLQKRKISIAASGEFN